VLLTTGVSAATLQRLRADATDATGKSGNDERDDERAGDGAEN